jgi:photosystem II stability/assembly factor-like uncharacterized protein
MRITLSSIALLLLASADGLPQGTAQLAVTVGGLPGGSAALVTVYGPEGYRRTLTGTSTLTGVAPGSYSIAAGVVTAGTVYLPVTFPSAAVQAVAGQTAAITVEYEALTGSWESVGPTAIQGGPGGLAGAGEIRPFAVNPGNLQEMYAASGGDGYFGPTSLSGLYKTTDGGATWTQRNAGLTDPVVDALWVDPVSPGNALAGTSAAGIFRTTDGGAHWSAAQSCPAITAPVAPVNAFLQVGGVLYAASGAGLLHSTDGGANWCIEQATTSPVWALSVSGGAIYMGLEDGHVMARASAGSAWVSAVPSASSARMRSVAASPANPSICYAQADEFPVSLYVTNDGGKTWSGVAALSGPPLTQAIAFQPSNPQTIFVGRDGQLFRSTDGGKTWPLLPGAGWDIRAIYPDSGGIAGRLIVASDQGLFLSRDNGLTWTSLNGNITSSIVYTVAVSGSTILAAMQDYGTLASYDGGKTWHSIANAEGGEVLFHPANPSYAYWYGQQLTYSTDGGKTFTLSTVKGSGMQYTNNRSIAVDPSNPSTLYVVGQDGIYESLDWGRTFAPANWPLPPYPTTIAVDPSDARTIFVGESVPDQGNALYVSHDKGVTWSKSDFGGTAYFPMSLAIDPSNSANVIAGLWGPYLSHPGNGVYVSTDGGRTFSPANTGIEAPGRFWWGMVNDVRFSPSFPGLVAAVMPNGVYLSSDLGGHWTNLRGMTVPYLSTGMTWANGYLYASTFGGGLLRMQFAAPVQVTPASASVGTAGGMGTLSVAGTASWKAVSNAAWITVTSAGAGTGNGTVGYSVAPNASAKPRTGAIAIGPYTFFVSQAPAAGGPPHRPVRRPRS